MGPRIGACLVVLTLLTGMWSDPVAAQDDFDYLPAAELLYDAEAEVLVDPRTGAEIVHPRFTTDDIVAFQDLVDATRWDVPEFLAEEALAFLFDEIAILAALDALDSNPEIDQVAAHYRDALAGVDRDTLLAGLDEVDEILDQIKGDIVRTGVLLPDAPAEALGDMSADDRTRLAAGERLPAGPYMAAMGALISQGTVRDLPPELRGIEFVGLDRKLDAITFPDDLAQFLATSPSAARGPVVAPTDLDGVDATDGSPGPLAFAPQDTAADGAGASSPIVWGAATAVLLVAAAVVVLRRRRRRPPVDDETLRSLIVADNEAKVATIACTEATRATGARRALLARPDEDGLHQIGARSAVSGSALQRVAETGTPLEQTLTDDPLVGPGPQVTLAVPVVSRGTVVGVLAVTRDNGTFGPDARAGLERLAPSVGAALVNVDRLGSVARLALVDELTRLGNRRLLDRDLRETARVAATDTTPVAFAMLDVDHFKLFNDAHGHAAGDRALQAVADIIARTVRDGDVVYRYGGEEFSILLPDATPDQAIDVAERVRAAVEQAPIEGQETQPGGTLTVSVGVSSLAAPDHEAVAARADQALYEAKQAGRNRVVCAAPDVS